MGLPIVVGSLSVMLILTQNMADVIKIFCVAWMIFFLLVGWFYHNKESVNLFIISLVCCTGIILFVVVQGLLINEGSGIAFAGILGGLILSAALYTMNLGHFYLNVHGLPFDHLKKGVYVFAGLLFIRLIWDFVQFSIVETIYAGRMVSLLKYSLTLDGIFLLLAIFFGVIFPLIGIYFVLETLKVKSTQSATGILYVLLSSVIIGDLSYKYYLIKDFLPL